MKNTCKIVSAILAVVLLLAISTPVFADDTDDTKETTISLDIPETFTWSVSDDIEIGDDIEVRISSTNICNDSFITVALTSATSYDSRGFFCMTAPGSNDVGFYKLSVSSTEDIETLPYTVLNFPENGEQSHTINTAWEYGDEPTAAGNYTDVLTFTAELHSHGMANP